MTEAMPLSELARLLVVLGDILISVRKIHGETIGWFCIADNGGDVINSTLVSDLANPKFITEPDETTRPVGKRYISKLLEVSRINIAACLVNRLFEEHNFKSEGYGVIKVPGEDLAPSFFLSFCSNHHTHVDDAIILCLACLSGYLDTITAREIVLIEVRPGFEALLKDVWGIHNRQ